MDEANQTIDIGNLSKFNSGALINLRLNGLWVDAHTHKRNGKYLSWNGDLDAVWCELAGDVKEGADNDVKWIEINQKLAKLEKSGKIGLIMKNRASSVVGIIVVLLVVLGGLYWYYQNKIEPVFELLPGIKLNFSDSLEPKDSNQDQRDKTA